MRNSRAIRNRVKRKLAEAAYAAVSKSFNETIAMAAKEGSHSSMHFVRWFVDAFEAELNHFNYVKPRRRHK